MYVQKALRVMINYVSVFAGTTFACGNTCVRGSGTHGDVLTLHTGFISVSRHTPRPRHSHNDTQPQPNNNINQPTCGSSRLNRVLSRAVTHCAHVT